MTDHFKILIYAFILFIYSFLHEPCYGQSSNVIDKAASKATDNIIDGLRNSIPDGSKIAITFFRYDNDLTDTLKTYLGIGISKQLNHELKKRILAKKLSYIILFPGNTDKMLNATMNNYFIPPPTDLKVDEFYKNLMLTEKPDFYLVGKYRIGPGTSHLSLSGMELTPNRFDPAVNNLRNIIFSEVEVNIDDPEDRSLISGLNHEVSQIPAWIDFSKRNNDYPANQYLCSFLSEKIITPDHKESVLSRLEKEAKNQLEECISQSLLFPAGVSTPEMRRSASTFAHLDPSVYNTLTYFDGPKLMLYVFLFSKRQTVAESCRKLYDQKISELRKLVNDAGDLLHAGNKLTALKKYAESFLLFRQLEEIQALTFAVENKAEWKETASLRNEVDTAMAGLKNYSFSNLDELCDYITGSFKIQVEKPSLPVILKPLRYQELDVTSAFSLRFQSVLETKLAAKAGYKISSRELPGGCNTISGNYWEEDDRLKLVLNLRDKDDIILASSEAQLPLDYLRQYNLSFKPENFETGFKNLKEIYKSPELQGDLQVDVLTNKGQKDLFFREGDTMQISVKSNKACYLRVVYYLADGQKILLLDNHPLSEDFVNKVYTIPDMFECTEPFGVEALQIFAQTLQFEKLVVREEYGRTYIIDDIPTICSTSTRGFSIIKEFAEKKLVITTLP